MKMSDEIRNTIKRHADVLDLLHKSEMQDQISALRTEIANLNAEIEQNKIDLEEYRLDLISRDNVLRQARTMIKELSIWAEYYFSPIRNASSISANAAEETATRARIVLNAINEVLNA